VTLLRAGLAGSIPLAVLASFFDANCQTIDDEQAQLI